MSQPTSEIERALLSPDGTHAWWGGRWTALGPQDLSPEREWVRLGGQWRPIAQVPAVPAPAAALSPAALVPSASRHHASQMSRPVTHNGVAMLRWWRDLDLSMKALWCTAAAVIVAGAGTWAVTSTGTAKVSPPTAAGSHRAAVVASPTNQPSALPASPGVNPIEASPRVVSSVSVTAACNKADADFTTVDTDSAAVMRGDDNEVVTGHSFGPLIIELRGLSENVQDSHLATLISTGTADVVGIRNLFVANGDSSTISTSLDPDIQKVSEYCSAQTDPLGNS
jgi:hypothetical protein